MTEAATAEVTQLPAPAPARRPAEIRVVNDPIAVLDTARFEHMQRIATVMARSNLIPDSLSCTTEFDETENKNVLVALPIEQVIANCFLVVNQAVRWNMDPFAVAQCVSVIHGKLCYEGKLIAAIVEDRLGVNLKYEWSGAPGTDAYKIKVWDADNPDHDYEGSVKDWKTKSWGTPSEFRKRLKYRADREWTRMWAPGLMLGIYTPDEFDDSQEARADRARVVEAPPKLGGLIAKLAHQPAEAATLAPTDNGQSELVGFGREEETSAPAAVVEAKKPEPIAEVVQAAAAKPVEEEKPPRIGSLANLAPKSDPQPAQASLLDAGDIPEGLRRQKTPVETFNRPSTDDPKKFLEWLDARLSRISEAEAATLETVWNDEVAPFLDGLSPVDQEEAAFAYRHHEARLAP